MTPLRSGNGRGQGAVCCLSLLLIGAGELYFLGQEMTLVGGTATREQAEELRRHLALFWPAQLFLGIVTLVLWQIHRRTPKS